eukprot:6970665-Alexandrium_andersonii.AAC.1
MAHSGLIRELRAPLEGVALDPNPSSTKKCAKVGRATTTMKTQPEEAAVPARQPGRTSKPSQRINVLTV